MSASQDRLSQALAEVRQVLEEVVRAEQHTDQLTQLPNDFALSYDLSARAESATDFWAAFIEVDHFKRLNDRYNYQNADALLRRIAEQLRGAATDFFGGAAKAYRAHGDEFYLTGDLGPVGEPEEMQQTLDHIRQSIARIRIPVQGHPTPMFCTVSVGWLLSMDLSEMIVERSIRTGLESAVFHAKRKGRNCTVRFSDALGKAATAPARDTCSACGASFTFDVPTAQFRSGPMFCPNCRAEVERPAPTQAPPTVLSKPV